MRHIKARCLVASKGEGMMNGGSSVFLTAFWASLGAPTLLYAEVPSFRPYIADLTPGDSFRLVGLFLNQAISDLQRDGFSANSAAGEQLSFEFHKS